MTRRKQQLWYYRYRFSFFPGLTMVNAHKHYEFVGQKRFGRSWRPEHDWRHQGRRR